MPTKIYVRKNDGNGNYGNPNKGAPSFTDEITTALPGRTWRVRADAGNVTVEVDGAPLTAGEDAALDTAYTNWTTITYSSLRLKEYMSNSDQGRDHRVIDYKGGLTTRLHKKLTTIFRGEVRKIEYFKDSTETNLVLDVNVSYNRTGNGLATDRTTTRTWYKKDGTAHPLTKVTVKEYDSLNQMMEGRRRRTNVISILTIQVLTMLVATTAANPANPTNNEILQAETNGNAFMANYTNDITGYLATGELSWAGAAGIGSDTTTWLDNNVVAYGWTGPTIRDEIQGALVDIMAP